MGIENIWHNGKIFAIVIRSDYEPDGVNFTTQKDSSIQLGF